MAVVIDQRHGFKLFDRPPRCKRQSFTQLDYQKLDFGQTNSITQSLEHAFAVSNIHRSFSTPCLSQSRDDYDTKARIEIIVGQAEPRVRALAAEVTMAMASGVNPELATKGLGGAYFLRTNNGDTIAVAKPTDEEPLAFNNPKGLAGGMLGQPGMKCSIKIGETGVRESAAYFLDHDSFARVPPTALVRFSHFIFNFNNTRLHSMPNSRIASLQRFVSHDYDAGDMGPSSFSVASVHRIGILDVRLMNLDRHAGNILVKESKDGYARGTAELVPIDHGFCLPECLDDPYFEWLHWPQASIPFSETEVNYISRLNPCRDAEILRTMVPSIRESSIRVLVLCTFFLKRATAYGLCLGDVGAMMTRELCEGNENLSTLEKLCIEAKAMLMDKLSNSRLDEQEDEDEDEEGEQRIDLFEFNDKHNYAHTQALDKDKPVGLFEIDDKQKDDLHLQLDILDSLQDSPRKGKPSKVPRITSMRIIDDSTSLNLNKKENYYYDYLLNDHGFNTLLDACEKAEDSKDNDNPMVGNGMLTKSQSFPAPNHNREVQSIITFGEMNDKEWKLFLEQFEALLPEAFEERKFKALSKQKLSRASCVF